MGLTKKKSSVLFSPSHSHSLPPALDCPLTYFFMSLSLSYSVYASLFGPTAIKLQYPPPPPQCKSIIPPCDPVANQLSNWLGVKKPWNRPVWLLFFFAPTKYSQQQILSPCCEYLNIRRKGSEVSAVDLAINAFSKRNVPATLVLPSDKKENEMLTHKFKLNIIAKMVNECTTNIIWFLWTCCVSRNLVFLMYLYGSLAHTFHSTQYLHATVQDTVHYAVQQQSVTSVLFDPGKVLTLNVHSDSRWLASDLLLASQSFSPLNLIQKATLGCMHQHLCLWTPKVVLYAFWSRFRSPSPQTLFNLFHLLPFVPLFSLRSALSLRQVLLINRHVTADKSGGIHKGNHSILHKANV